MVFGSIILEGTDLISKSHVTRKGDSMNKPIKLEGAEIIDLCEMMGSLLTGSCRGVIIP